MRFSLSFRIVIAALTFGLAACTPPKGGPQAAEGDACSQPGAWLDTDKRQILNGDALIRTMAEKDVVLLGETHTNHEHHRWQAYMLAALHAARPEMAVGFEMFPRSVQEALDDWTHGHLTQSEFLRQSRWREVWVYPSGYYMPLFDLVRQHRLPAVALNVERALVSRVGREGWAAVPEADRLGVGDPAPASDAYKRSLADVYTMKLTRMKGGSPHGRKAGEDEKEDTETPDEETVLADEAFGRFVDAQLTWDRAMAEAIVATREENPDKLVVGIVGRGHAEFGHGIPHQLRDLGVDDVAVLLPVETGDTCRNIPSGIADAAFVVEPDEASGKPAPKARLGVMIETKQARTMVISVLDGSVAAAAGIEDGDIIQTAAGFVVTSNAGLVEIIQRQAPGTWLPLQVLRGGETKELVAKFPQSFGE